MKKLLQQRIFLVALICIGLATRGDARSNKQAPPTWVGSWAASQQIPEPNNALNPDDLHDATLRQIVHLSVGGNSLRVHLSNAFGTMPLHLTSVHIARPVSPSEAKIDVATDKALIFSGRNDVIIPAGAEYISDPVAYPVAPLSDLAITLHLDTPPERQTGHPGSRSTSYLIHGDMVAVPDLPDAKKIDHWYWIAGVDVNAIKDSASIVVLGDSITDGHGATTNGNDRWTDELAKKLQADRKTKMLAVLNHGIGGNHLLTDGLGPNALARFDRDVLAQAGVRYLIILEGVNDLGKLSREGEVPHAAHDALVQLMIGAYQQIVARAHTHGIKVFGATILPYVGSEYYHPASANEADRLAVNAWIRAPGHFDAVIDFDKLTADPAHPDRMLPAYDSGDHLHPSPAGYHAMGDAVPVALFAR
ncbi:MAG TPA: SGNH/GDSL hydrolase family protein [Terriglobales bacterium]|jgi:lysophospholipase L1-like esterase|nr:SGNH/GDSL hydrolase family protein [Terriglobales bacterium]